MPKRSPVNGDACASVTETLRDDELLLCVQLVTDVFEPRHLVSLASTCSRLHKITQVAREDLQRMCARVTTMRDEHRSNHSRVAAVYTMLNTPMPPPPVQKQHRLLLLHAATAAAKLTAQRCVDCDTNKETLGRAGVVQTLVGLLEDPPCVGSATILAAAVANLANGNDANRAAFVAAGVLPPLVAMAADERAPETNHLAAAVLGNLARHHDNKERIADAGALVPLLALTRRDGVPRKTAAEVLRSLARNEVVRAQLIALGCPRHIRVANTPTNAAASGAEATTKPDVELPTNEALPRHSWCAAPTRSPAVS